MCPTALPTPTMASEFTADERVAELTDQLRRSSSVRMPAVFPLAKQKRPRTASQSASALPALADAADARDADEGSLDSRPPGTAPVGSRSMSQRQKDALNHLVKMVAEHDALPAVVIAGAPGEGGDMLSVTSLGSASARTSGDRRKAQGAALLRRMSVMQDRQGVLHEYLEMCRRKHIEGAARIAGYEEALVQSVADKAMRADERRDAAESAGRAQIGLRATFAGLVRAIVSRAARAPERVVGTPPLSLPLSRTTPRRTPRATAPRVAPRRRVARVPLPRAATRETPGAPTPDPKELLGPDGVRAHSVGSQLQWVGFSTDILGGKSRARARALSLLSLSLALSLSLSEHCLPKYGPYSSRRRGSENSAPSATGARLSSGATTWRS